MPALRGTRAPEGTSLPRPHGQGIYREVVLWPGIAWGRDARCLCSWAARYGVVQVKVRSGACTVHIARVEPEARECERRQVTARDEVPLPELLGQLIALLAEALQPERDSDRDWCGTDKGYKRHLREKTETCPACRWYERERTRRRRRLGAQAAAGAAEQEAA